MSKIAIVGKGPSLDFLKPKHFEPMQIVLAINDAVFRVCELNIKLSLYAIQMDYEIGELKGLFGNIASERCREFGLYKGNNFAEFFKPEYFDLSPSCVTASFAVMIAKRFFQAHHINMLCFDAMVNGNCEYADCISKTSDAIHTNKQRFLDQKEEIQGCLDFIPHNWTIPEK